MVSAPVCRRGAAFDQAGRFHAVEEAADVSFGDEQPFCQLLLGDAFGHAEIGKHVELGEGEAGFVEDAVELALDLLVDAGEAEPGLENVLASLGEGCTVTAGRHGLYINQLGGGSQVQLLVVSCKLLVDW